MLIKWLLALALLLVALWWFGPREPAELGPVRVELPADVSGWLTAREAGVAPDLAARIDWAGAPGGQTDLAVVYLHGFSAAPPETRPLAENVAAALGANLFVARLTGHGQDGPALAQASVADWWRDTAEAIAVGHRLGRRVVVIGTSTGGTLAVEAARDAVLGPQIDAMVLISPNLRIKNKAAALLTLPLARYWVPLVAGRERCFEPKNPAHAAGWTTCYPTTAVMPMAALVARSRQGGFEKARQPLLVIRDSGDQVVDSATADRVLAGWGGDRRVVDVETAVGDDPNRHVIAGDILSPGATTQMVQTITDWLRGLPR